MKETVHGHVRLMLLKRARPLPGLHKRTLTQRRELPQVKANREKCYFNLQQLLGLALT